MRRWLVGCSVLIAVAAGGGFAGVTEWRTSLERPGPLAADAAIVVPHGATSQLAGALAADGVIAHPILFRAAAWLTRADGTLHAAEFAFPAHASINEVLAILRTAKPVEHRLTIAEGLTAQQIQTIVSHADALAGEYFSGARGQCRRRPTSMSVARRAR